MYKYIIFILVSLCYIGLARASGQFVSVTNGVTTITQYVKDDPEPMITIYEKEPPKIHSITKISETELIIK